MSILKAVAFALAGLMIGVGGGSAAYAKAHDQGVADGTQIVAPGETRGEKGGDRGSFVSGNDTLGVGPGLGVAAEGDLTYGQSIVSPIRGDNRVVPVGAPGQNK